MYKSIVWSDPDFNNGVARIVNGIASVEKAEEWIALLKERGEIPLGITPSIVDTEGNISEERSHRDAWIHDTSESPNTVGVRVGLARDISIDRVRENRNTKLKELDIDLKAAEIDGKDTAPLLTKRQNLLDATEALKALDLNDDGVITVEEASDTLIPLELIAA